MLIKAAGTPDTAGTIITEGTRTRVELQEQKGFQQKQKPSNNRNANNIMNAKKEGKPATVKTPTTEGTTTTVETTRTERCHHWLSNSRTPTIVETPTTAWMLRNADNSGDANKQRQRLHETKRRQQQRESSNNRNAINSKDA
jgi:hypothetical protein